MDADAPDLTRRERDVLTALCRPVLDESVFTEPASVREIAGELVVTEAAVKQHLLHLYDKFRIPADVPRRRLALARAAIDRGAVTMSGIAASRRRTVDRDNEVREAREASSRRDWASAFDRFAAADSVEGLGVDDLESAAEAAWWLNRHDESIELKRRAFRAHLSAGETLRAAAVALLLTINHFNRLELAVADGWFSRANRILADTPRTPVDALAAIVRCALAEASGEWEVVLSEARLAQAIALGVDADLEALGIAFEGLALTHSGEVDAGTQLLDEAMASAIGGALGPMATGIIYCRMLCACLDVHDFGRAGEWTDAILSQLDTPALPGDCQTHRAAVLIKRGDWAGGAAEARMAADRATTLELSHVGIASAELAGMLLRQGDLDGAEEALLRAREYGALGEPGLALLRLARGDPAGARQSLDGALAGLTGQPLARARLLAVRVQVAVATGDFGAAETATCELEQTARLCTTPALRAAAEQARGTLELGAGDPRAALRNLEAAHRLWQQADAPYEAAEVRVLLAEAHLACGDRSDALHELRSACATFDRLGARPASVAGAARLAALETT
jgi:ATP/maltotriose-dependent transcriptional regulator MalT